MLTERSHDKLVSSDGISTVDEATTTKPSLTARKFLEATSPRRLCAVTQEEARASKTIISIFVCDNSAYAIFDTSITRSFIYAPFS